MRTENIQYTKETEIKTGVLEYPDLWCFVFNPNYVTIKMDDETMNGQMTVTLSTPTKSYDIFVNLYKGTAKVFVSKILQLLLDDVEHHRTSVVTISVSDNDVSIMSSNISCIAVWGGIQMGEQFGKYGAFISNGKDHSHVRNVVWFKNFPFYVSMFRAEPGELTSFKSDYVAPGTREQRLYRCHIDRVVEGDLPTFQMQSKVFDNPPVIVFNITHGVVYAVDGSVLIAPVMPMARIVGGYGSINSTPVYEGGFAQIEGSVTDMLGEAYNSWIAHGIYGSRLDYNDQYGNARDDVEFEYGGEIVRWNSNIKQLEKATMGNAGTEGIFELNPAITFPDAIHKAQYNICLEKVTSGIFNMNFNFPFPDMSKVVNETVNLRISNDKDGMYLRWIDRYGLMQFYLFVKGESSIKTKASSNVVRVERTFSGVNFGSLERSIERSNTETRKCCAVNLPKDVLEYVKTIISAPMVDLYLGKNKAGTELWLPVGIADGTYKTDPDTLLSDYEISILMPENISQTL